MNDTQSVYFSGLQFGGHKEKGDISITGYPGNVIDDNVKHGQISLVITGQTGDGVQFETVMDLELPQAKAIVAAILALISFVEQEDAEHLAVSTGVRRRVA